MARHFGRLIIGSLLFAASLNSGGQASLAGPSHSAGTESGGISGGLDGTGERSATAAPAKGAHGGQADAGVIDKSARSAKDATTDVSLEYDGMSDFPTYPMNVLGDVNAIAGMLLVHTPPPGVAGEEITSKAEDRQQRVSVSGCDRGHCGSF